MLIILGGFMALIDTPLPPSRGLTRVGKILIRSAKSRFCSEISDFARSRGWQ